MIFKKAFTLAEVVMTISVIAVLAVATVPGIVKSTTEKQIKMGLKKSYSTLASSYANARIKGLHPKVKDGEDYGTVTKYTALRDFYVSILETARIREITKFRPNDDQGVTDTKNLSIKVTYNPTPTSTTPKTVGINTTGNNKDNVDLRTLEDKKDKTVHTWITTEDGLSYYFVNSTKYNCKSKRTISKHNALKNMIKDSCITIFVDANGIHKGPNRFEPQQYIDISGKKLAPLSGDQYYLFVASDGVSSGNEETYITAKIIESN